MNLLTEDSLVQSQVSKGIRCIQLFHECFPPQVALVGLCWDKIRCHIFILLAFSLHSLVPAHGLAGCFFCGLSDFNVPFLLFFSRSHTFLCSTFIHCLCNNINFVFCNFALHLFYFSIFISMLFSLFYALIVGHNSSVISDKKPENCWYKCIK